MESMKAITSVCVADKEPKTLECIMTKELGKKTAKERARIQEQLKELHKLGIDTVDDLDIALKYLYKSYNELCEIKNRRHKRVANAIGWEGKYHGVSLVYEHPEIGFELYKLYDITAMHIGEIYMLSEIFDIGICRLLYTYEPFIYGGSCGRLREAICLLEEKHINIVIERYYKGKTYRKIGNKIGCSGSNCREIIHKLLRRFRRPCLFVNLIRGVQVDLELAMCVKDPTMRKNYYTYIALDKCYDVERQRKLLGAINRAINDDTYIIGADYKGMYVYEDDDIEYIRLESIEDIRRLREMRYSPKIKQ